MYRGALAAFIGICCTTPADCAASQQFALYRHERKRAHEKNEKGEFNPTYRCLFPDAPPPGTVPACAEAGVMGALAGVMGSMMALEAIREIVGFGDGLVGRLLMIDARAMRFETLRYARDPANPLNGDEISCAEYFEIPKTSSLKGRYESAEQVSHPQCIDKVLD